MAFDILIVDDEADIRSVISGILEDEGYTTRQAADGPSALAAVNEKLPHAVILDIWMANSELDGLEVLDTLQKVQPDVPVIMISGHGTIETAVTAIKKGAYDFIEKPFKADRLLLLVERSMEAARLRREVADLKQRAGRLEDLIGESTPIQQLRRSIDRVAPTGSRVLITGPAGTGKEVVARLIHDNSPRASAPFVVVNCAAMSTDGMDVALFGEEGGEGPSKVTKVGLLEKAQGGTVLLDEVADMPLDTQGKMIRVLQDQNFQRVNGSDPVEVDVRIIATSNHDLRFLIAEDRFREELFYRLNVVPITVPSLAERRQDIPLLAEYFMGLSAATNGTAVRPLAEDALAALQSYDWPGNVRQLKNVIDWLLIMAPGDNGAAVRADMLPGELIQGAPETLKLQNSAEIMALPLRNAREMFEREYLMAQVIRFGGNISRTAEFVGMERSALHRKLKTLGVSSEARG